MEHFTEEIKKIIIKKSKIKYKNVNGKCILVLDANVKSDYLVDDKDVKQGFLSMTNTEKCPFCGIPHTYQDNQNSEGIQKDFDGIWKKPKCHGKKFKTKIKTPNGTILYQADGVLLNIDVRNNYNAKELQ